MKAAANKSKLALGKKFQKVQATPASFEFFVAIHDFVGHIELNASLTKGLSGKLKANRELDIAGKYDYLKKIHQGIDDITSKSNNDLGHDRYMVIKELSQIKNQELSESNSFWRKRELVRKLAGLVYERLDVYLSE